jgi:hypothetical protein
VRESEDWLAANADRLIHCPLHARITPETCRAVRRRSSDWIDGTTSASRPPQCATCTAWKTASAPKGKLKKTPKQNQRDRRKSTKPKKTLRQGNPQALQINDQVLADVIRRYLDEGRRLLVYNLVKAYNRKVAASDRVKGKDLAGHLERRGVKIGTGPRLVFGQGLDKYLEKKGEDESGQG